MKTRNAIKAGNKYIKQKKNNEKKKAIIHMFWPNISSFLFVANEGPISYDESLFELNKIFIKVLFY